MKHLKEYFNDFEASKLRSIFGKLYQDGWEVSEESFVDSVGVIWNYRDIDYFVFFNCQTFATIVASYKIFLESLGDSNISSSEGVENIQEKLESANSKIKLLEEQNSSLKKELDVRGKELCDLKTSEKSQKPSKTETPIEYPKPKASTKEYIALKRRKYVKIE